MAGLRSYSCSKCGGILNVDRGQELYECPFCGTAFETLDFHRNDFMNKADDLLFHGDFRGAKETYQDLLLKQPGDFDALLGLVLCAGPITSISRLENPVNLGKSDCAGMLKVLEDSAYSEGIGASYFAKLRELILQAEELKKIRQERRKQRLAFDTLATVNELHISQRKKYERSSPVNTVNRVPQNKETEIVSEQTYAKLYAELIDLFPDKNEELLLRQGSDKSAITRAILDASKVISCNKCGAELELDEEKGLYECRHCGIAYGYSLFCGDPIKKANDNVERGEFTEADERFIHMLMVDPNNFLALRGRILCAAQWTGFAELKLGYKMTEERWVCIMERFNEAKEISGEPSYFIVLGKLLEIVKRNYENSLKRNNDDFDQAEVEKVALSISSEYDEVFHRFIRKDIKMQLKYSK